VRGTTRDAGRTSSIETAGVEAVLADPDRVMTLAPAIAGVAVVCVLLGSAEGPPDAVAALHSERLEMLLTRVLDTPVRGFVYESSGAVEQTVLAGGASLVRSFCATSRIPFALLDRVGSEGWSDWAARGADAIDAVLTPE
jgi:uncharacterized protein YbjT (DUF2867 family)